MILLWDSSGMSVHICLVINESRFDYEWQAERTLARDMLGYLQGILANHDCTLSDVSQIGVFRGPGSYTGLRIGLTVLNTIADAQQIPIVGGEGASWKDQVVARLRAGENDRVVLPEYGSVPHVTKPRK